ncbi:bacterial extracellular solute-binding protein family 5 [Clostridium sp. CAG:1013]|jgi:peptide/nickel transport system substrate-binding protein|nr:bacterial extracellular solute-binding protein family 5 [Clostridium sp. CAG:1013]
MQKRILSLVLALTLLVTAFAGCTGSGTTSGSSTASTSSSGEASQETSTESQTSSTDSGEETVVRMNIGSEPDSLDPWQSAASDTDAIFHNVFEGLCLYDENGEIIPGLAESWDISEDGLTYTFHLRDDVTFHNGKAFTSADVVYTYNNLAGMGGEKAVSSKFENVESFEAPDDYTFVIKLKEPSAGFLSLNIIAILPEGYEDQSTAPVGTGPYKFVEYTPSQRVVLEKNDEYYDEERAGKIDRVEFYIMTDSAAVVSALQSGTLDIASINADDASVLEGQFDIYNSPQNMVQIFAMNNSVEPFNDVRVRQAINYAIDKDQIINTVFGGYATKLYTNFSPVMGVYYNEELEGSYDTDLEKAKELLKEAGYENGFDFTITVPANYQAHIDTAQIISQQLQQIGITANIETIEWATWLEDVYTNAQYETTIVGLTGKLDPDAVLGRFKTDYPKNFFKFSDAEYDELITSALTEQDEQVRVDDYKRCQEILTEQAAAAFISDPNLVVASRKDLKGYTFYPVTFHDMTKLYYEG